MEFAPLIALSQAWTDSIGLAFTFFVLIPVIATICVYVAFVSGRGEKSDDSKLSGRWGRKPPS